MTPQNRAQDRFLDPKADLVFKKIFGQHPDLVQSFLNSILPLPEGRQIQSVEYLPSEQTPRIPGMKNTIVDVKCKDEKGQIFIVEMQMTWSKSFLSRFLFGTSKAFVQQLGAGKTEAYGKLCPVYGLALVNEPFEQDMEGWFHHYRLTHTQNLDKTLEGIELVFVELPKFTPTTFAHRKLGALWLRFLKEAETMETVPEEFQKTPELAKALELAKESAFSPEELEAYDQYLDAFRVVETIREDSREEGERIGLEKGERIGLEKGEQKVKDIAEKMLAKGTSIEDVRDLTGLPMETLQSLRHIDSPEIQVQHDKQS